MPLHLLMSSTSYIFEEVSDFEIALQDTRPDSESFTGFFNHGDIVLVRVPARLDVMGGIANYSGSNACEGTLTCGVALGIQLRNDQKIQIKSLRPDQENFVSSVNFSLDRFWQNGVLISPEILQQLLRQDPNRSWSAYILGSIYVLLQENLFKHLQGGFNIGINSKIASGAGIASSAALVIGTLQALNIQLGLGLTGEKLARLGQVVENKIVGAPCGIMDLLAVTAGSQSRLTHILCQPGQIQSMISIPEEYEFIGINSMVADPALSDAYRNLRVSTFMGRKIISLEMQKRNLLQSGKLLPYLCNLLPEDFENNYRNILPEKITGQAFLETYGEPEDEITRLQPEQIYVVRGCTAHPIYENDRVLKLIELLKKASEEDGDVSIKQIGRLMSASHESYRRNCNLSNEKVELLVEIVKEVGRKFQLYGAKITGGGFGGTVAAVGKKKNLPEAINIVAENYFNQTGLTPQIFRGSSPGAFESGTRIYRYTV